MDWDPRAPLSYHEAEAFRLERERRYFPSPVQIKRAVKDGVLIEYVKDQNRNFVSYDERLVETWRKEVDQVLMQRNICCFVEGRSLLEPLLYGGKYMPFLSRMNREDHFSHLLLRAGKGKIYVNNTNRTEKLLIRKNTLLQWLSITDNLGTVFGFVRSNFGPGFS